MNFLKKQIKNVVKGKRNKDDDDDDFDNYVPEVPPHPSTLTENGVLSATFTGNTENLLPSIQSTLTNSINPIADSDVKSVAGIDSTIDPEPANPDKTKLSLEELKAREEEHKQKEKEKLKEQEKSKENNEDWKYFLSLTAKVEAVTLKTKSTLNKLKDESAVKEINKIEDPCYIDQFDAIAPKAAGGWIAFEEQEKFNPADPIFTIPQEG